MPPTISQIERMSPPFYDEEAERIHYPESDGKPMADNTKQFRYIATLKGGFDSLYKERDDVFVAGDLLWYPVEGDNKTRYAPDVMIAFGRPPGDRGSYMQWLENGQPPNVVFEVLSPGNTKAEMDKKFKAYDQYRVDEYYEYDPDRGTLKGWLRQEKGEPLRPVEDMQYWKSPATGVTFHLEEDHLVVTRPDGKIFLTPQEADDAIEEQTRRADKEQARANEEQARAEKEQARAEKEQARAEKERARANEAQARTEKERAKAAKMAEKLRELGIDPEEIS